MLTKEDKEFLTETFATNKELVGVKIDVANLQKDVTDLKVDSKLLQVSMIRLEKKVDKSSDLAQEVLTVVQGFAGKVADLDQENKMGSITLQRHDIQIHELATATGTTISD